ncbi:hypothetical protein BBP40_011975 [Aspergillus hancockii]|nr:hypothetical protein BBP40_011975 [Aspergillus hancockii]
MSHSRSITLIVRFYTEILGFQLGGEKVEEDTSELTFCSVFMSRKANTSFYFSEVTEGGFKPSEAMIALGTRELDVCYQYLKGHEEVTLVEGIEDTPCGFRQFTIRDGDGNKLTFFKFLEGHPGEE